MPTSQSASAVLMVQPTTFGFDEQTARTNTYQHRPTAGQADTAARAAAEFDQYTKTLRRHGIEVVEFEDTPAPPKPNAVFPNNWLTTWPDGRVFVYPMATLSRRLERSPEIIGRLAETFVVEDTLSLIASEAAGRFLEGTGAMVFDHPSKLVYACLSARCDEALLRRHAADLGYTPVIFTAVDQGTPLYHTNVMMGIQSANAVMCSAAITSAAERHRVLGSLKDTGHEVVDITPAQLAQFCGNVIELRSRTGQAYLVMSAAAHVAFTPAQLAVLGRDRTILTAAIPTIESIGGGGVRCMVAEIFLPRRKA